jgi:hypothetical protein
VIFVSYPHSKNIFIGFFALFMLFFGINPAFALSRIKDLANVEGIRQNQLIGYGLVVGLTIFLSRGNLCRLCWSGWA